MSEGQFVSVAAGPICGHGQLAGSCEVCDLRAQLADAQASIADLRMLLDAKGTLDQSDTTCRLIAEKLELQAESAKKDAWAVGVQESVQALDDALGHGGRQMLTLPAKEALSELREASSSSTAASQRVEARIEEAVGKAREEEKGNYFRGWPDGVNLRDPHKRIGDMHPDDCIYVMADASGDACLSLVTDRGWQTIEFCTSGAGGGRSPRTRVAVLRLAQAIALDEEADRIRSGCD